MQSLKIAYIQADLYWENPEANMAHFDQLFNRLKQENDLIVLPETFTTGFPVDPKRFAQPLDGTAMHWMAKRAASLDSVICGSILLEQQGRFTNTLVWMRPNGRYELYAKRHVFRMGGEHQLIDPGNYLLTVELKGWRIRPMICYDLRFPVWSRNSYRNGVWGYDLALYVSSWPTVRSYPWKQLLIARAIENQACVLGVNRVGEDGLGNSYTGDSALIDAKGYYVSQAATSEEEIVESELDPKHLLEFREKFMVSLDWDEFKILHLPPDTQ